MSLGKVDKYKVLRETNLGYVLGKDDVEYFLHHNECNGKILEENDIVKAFLYMDKKNRLAATLFPPVIEENQIGFLKVVGVRKEIGVFCSIGISKDILLSKDDLGLDFKLWPLEEESIVGELRVKNDHLLIKPATKTQIIAKRKELLEKEGLLEANPRLALNELTKGRVYRISDDGINIVTDNYEIIFIYKTNFRKKYHLGEIVETKIIDIHEDDYSGMINKPKEYQIQDDLKIIVDYLNKNNGVSLITEKSAPELITKVFNMSKASFKKALGSLLKQRKIEITETKIILLDYQID